MSSDECTWQALEGSSPPGMTFQRCTAPGHQSHERLIAGDGEVIENVFPVPGPLEGLGERLASEGFANLMKVLPPEFREMLSVAKQISKSPISPDTLASIEAARERTELNVAGRIMAQIVRSLADRGEPIGEMEDLAADVRKLARALGRPEDTEESEEREPGTGGGTAPADAAGGAV